MLKRIIDLFFAGTGLFLLSPFFLFISLWIKFDSAGPVFFRQERVGQFGKPFRIHKFRTMFINQNGMQLTIANDRRITRSGVFLRRYKIDELPQLIDVLIGNMSLVGPRPEVPKYVAFYPDKIRELVLSVKPGITDFASIEFCDENEILSQAENPEKSYIEDILPIKLKHYIKYAINHNLFMDFFLILRTLQTIGRKR